MSEQQGRARLRQLWFVAFAVGAMMINYPLLHIFNQPAFVGGYPLLFLYFVVGWAASIAVIALYAWALRHLPSDGPD